MKTEPIIAVAVLAIGAVWLVPGLFPSPDKPQVATVQSATSSFTAPAVPPGGPTIPAVGRASFRAPSAGGKPTAACVACEEAQCKDLLSVCEKQVGNASAGSATGKAKADLCRQLISCVRDTGCGGAQVIDCFCGSADATECNSGKANGACLAAFQAAAETTVPSTVLERTSDASYAAGAASSLLMCDEDACRRDCLPYYR